MKRTHFLIISLLSAIACRQHDNDPSRTALLKSLDKSKTFIEQANVSVYKEMESREEDPRTHERTVLWRPKVLTIQHASHDFIEYIDDLRAQAKKISGKELSEKINAFKRTLKDSLSPASFPDSPHLREVVQSDRPWIKEVIDGGVTLPDGLSEVDQTLLSGIRNDVCILENILIKSLLRHTQLSFCGFTVYRGLFGINSSYFKRGQPLIITAGIGGFQVLQQLRVTIDGQQIDLDEDNVAQYRTTANGQPGKHTIQARLEFTRPDGVTATMSKNIEYEIAP